MDRIHYVVPSVIRQYFFCKALKNQYKYELHDFDLIFPNNGVWGIRLANEIKNRSGAKVVYTGHGGIGLGEEIIIRNKPDLYIAITPQALKWAKSFTDKAIFIPNAVEPEKFNCHPNKDSVKKKQVLCVGAFVDFKRQELLIEAMQHLPDFCLTLLGKGDKIDFLQSKCKKLIPGKFEIKELPYELVLKEYNNAGVFSLPSHNEPFGIVYLEALCSGLPVVVPDDDVRRFICGDYAVYCDVENPEDYANAILEAYNNLDMTGSAEYVSERFSWKAISDQYIKKFLDLL